MKIRWFIQIFQASEIEITKFLKIPNNNPKMNIPADSIIIPFLRLSWKSLVAKNDPNAKERNSEDDIKLTWNSDKI